MKVGLAIVGYERVGYPDLVQHVRADDELVDAVERQPPVDPRLPEKEVHGVVLDTHTHTHKNIHDDKNSFTSVTNKTRRHNEHRVSSYHVHFRHGIDVVDVDYKAQQMF